MENNEQWIHGGNCSKCRRQKYCHTQCKANRSFMMNNAIAVGAQIVSKWLERGDKRDQ